MVPIYAVEKPGFINMLKVLDPKYVLPSQIFALPQLYTYVIPWGNGSQRSWKRCPFILPPQIYGQVGRCNHTWVLLCTFITNDWTLRSICLQTAYFPEDHTGEIIAQGLRDALTSWNLAKDRLICMTTDSGSNMIKALKDNAWPNLQCFGHRLHNAIGKSK